MNANIISRAFNQVNEKMAKAIASIDIAIGYQAERLAEENASRWAECQRSLYDVLNVKQMPLSNFQWEFDGGDAGATARVVLSALNTAYYAAFAAYRRENVLIKDNGKAVFDTPAFVGSKFDQSWDAAYTHGLGNSDHDEVEDQDHRTFAECMHSVAHVLGYAVHIARFDGNSWMISFDVRNSFDGTKSTIFPLKDMVAWGQQQFEETGDERFAIFKSNPSLFSVTIPDVAECKEHMRAWLNEYTPLSEEQAKRAKHPYDTRHERIIARVGERKFGEYLYDLRQGKVYSEEKHGAILQIIACTPFFADQVNSFKASDVWMLHEKEVVLKQLEKKAEQAAKIEEERLFNERVQSALTRIDTLLKAHEPQEPKVEETASKVEEPQAAVTGIHGTRSAFTPTPRRGNTTH